MSRSIIIRGAREHNLKNLDVEIPRDKLVVITGLSGTGKSSLAFDTIYAEGQRRYVESLKGDFPRIPFPQDRELLAKMARLGKKLIDLHLLRSPELDSPIARFQGVGKNKVEKPRYSDQDKRTHINAAQYFEGVEQAVWEYQVGGYQVCEKWLKDRKVVTALAKTIEIQGELDQVYPQIERETLEPRMI